MRKRVSHVLHAQIEDLQELYTAAKLNDNGALMEKLGKSIADMARKIKDQELHEKETISRSEFLALITDTFQIIGEEHMVIEDENFRTSLIDRISDRVAEVAEERFTNAD